MLGQCDGNDIEVDGFHRRYCWSRTYSIDDGHYQEQEVLDMPCTRCMGGGDSTPMGDKWAGLGAEAKRVTHGPVMRFGRQVI